MSAYQTVLRVFDENYIAAFYDIVIERSRNATILYRDMFYTFTIVLNIKTYDSPTLPFDNFRFLFSYVII